MTVSTKGKNKEWKGRHNNKGKIAKAPSIKIIKEILQM